MLARFLRPSQQATSRLGAQTQDDLERLLGRTDAGVLLAARAEGLAGALGYSFGSGSLRLFSFTLLMEEGEHFAHQVARTLLHAAEDVARENSAVVMAAHVDKHSGLMAAFLDAGFSIDEEEPEASSGGRIIPVAGVIKLLEPTSP